VYLEITKYGSNILYYVFKREKEVPVLKENVFVDLEEM
jgi:hypothetical protein